VYAEDPIDRRHGALFLVPPRAPGDPGQPARLQPAD